jgi:hypothetical protein
MAANGVSRYTFSAVFPLFAVQSEFNLFVSESLYCISDVCRSVQSSWRRMGNVSPRFSGPIHVAHPMGVLQMGTNNKGKEQISADGLRSPDRDESNHTSDCSGSASIP